MVMLTTSVFIDIAFNPIKGQRDIFNVLIWIAFVLSIVFFWIIYMQYVKKLRILNDLAYKSKSKKLLPIEKRLWKELTGIKPPKQLKK